jgi:hypothetical protein
VWPQSEQDQFKIVDYSMKSKVLFTPLASIVSGRYDFSTPIFHPLYRKDEPRREPNYKPVQYLHIVAGLAPLSMSTALPMETSEDGSAPTTPEMSKPVMDDSEFNARPEPGVGNGALPGRNGLGATPGLPSGSGPGPASRAPTTASGTRAATATGSGISGLSAFQGMPGAPAGPGLGAVGSDVKALGVRYIAVRGVFPLREQITAYKNALHLSEAEAASLIEITDFVLERQTAMAGSDPWKDSEWKKVSLTRAEEILEECSDLDPLDPVPTRMKDPVITMNLPLRLLFTWGPAATHPKIKDEEMKAEEIQMEDKLLEALDKTMDEAKVQETKKTRLGGLAPKQRDVRSAVRSLANSSDGMNMYRQMASRAGNMQGGSSSSMGASRQMPSMPMSSMGSAGAAGGYGAGSAMMGQMGSAMAGPMSSMMGMGMGMGAMRTGTGLDRLVVNSQYLLFRYLDFDVEPGKAYRYRVRLTLRNPNFDLSPEELGSADVEITKGEDRETPWSNISNPEVVPQTVNFYLKTVEREPYNEEHVKTNTSKPVAQLSIFDWDTKLGTVITDMLKIPAIGGFIGEEKKEPLVLDLAEGTLDKKKNHNFTTLNVLVDVESDVEVEADKHPDLKLSGKDRRGMTHLGLMPEALVALESGAIEAIDPISEKTEEQRWQNRAEHERKGREEGAAPARSVNRLDALVGSTPGAKDDEKQGTRKRRNPRRGTPSSSSSSSMEAMMMMQQQMMNSPGAAPAKKKK